MPRVLLEIDVMPIALWGKRILESKANMNIDNYLSVHADSLKLRSRRTAILAQNIANSDTPNYKARDLAFAEVLRSTQPGAASGAPGRTHLARSSTTMRTTHGAHLQGTSAGRSPELMYRNPEQASLDGNTVDKDQEQARFAENNIRYQASLKFINGRVSGLIRALKGE